MPYNIECFLSCTDHVIRATLRHHITELETECDKIRAETETEAETTISTHTPAKAGADYEMNSPQ